MSGTSAEIDGATVLARQGDLTAQDVDAIVNAANSRLQHGGGVAAAIASAGGPAIQEESDAYVAEHGALEDGEAAVTTAGDMPAAAVVHVAGPVYEEDRDDNEHRLRAAVRGALQAAAEEGHTSIALPAISAGVYGYPPEEATAVIASEVTAFLTERDDHPISEVRLIGLDETTTDLFADGITSSLA